MLVPLSSLDVLETSSITLGYVLESVDNATLEAAAKRVVDKWRLLAGRLERNASTSSSTSRWSIRVPLEGDVSSRLNFTTSKLAVPLDTPNVRVDATSSEILLRPSLKFFRHSSTPSSLSSFSSSNSPLVSIHVTELSDCTCVGISVPHGVFDAFGLGQIISGLDAELNGKVWTPPVYSETNNMQQTIQELSSAAPLYTEELAALAHVRRDFASGSVKNMVSAAVGIAYEYLWQKAEVRAVYLGEKVIDEIVRRVKDEVESSGSGFVSTGDILVAWFLKAAYHRESDNDTVCIMSLVSIRSLLAEKDPALNNYTHHGFVPCCCPSLSKKEITSKSLAELAVIHRKALDDMRNFPFVQAYLHWVAKVDITMPTRRRGADPWIFSNQVIGRFDEIDFGSEMRALWVWNVPFAQDHLVVLNRLKGGYMLQGIIRRSRWEAVAEEVESTKKGENVNAR